MTTRDFNALMRFFRIVWRRQASRFVELCNKGVPPDKAWQQASKETTDILVAAVMPQEGSR